MNLLNIVEPVRKMLESAHLNPDITTHITRSGMLRVGCGRGQANVSNVESWPLEVQCRMLNVFTIRLRGSTP